MNPFPRGEPGPWIPNQDMFINQVGDLVIELELSHLARENITLVLEGNRLHVAGRRSGSADPAPAHYLVRQINRGHFSFTVDIADHFAAHAGRAQYSNGILRICVPPTAKLRDRRHPPEPPLGGA